MTAQMIYQPMFLPMTPLQDFLCFIGFMVLFVLIGFVIVSSIHTWFYQGKINKLESIEASNRAYLTDLGQRIYKLEQGRKGKR